MTILFSFLRAPGAAICGLRGVLHLLFYLLLFSFQYAARSFQACGQACYSTYVTYSTYGFFLALKKTLKTPVLQGF